MSIRPLHDRLIVQRLEESGHRAGGIIIPDSAKEKPQQGKVLAAGLGKADKDGKRVTSLRTAIHRADECNSKKTR
jgi:chaperonin GroES